MFKLQDTRFLLALTSPAAPVVGYLLGMNFYTLAVFFVAVPIVDLVIGRRAEPSPAREIERLERSLFFRAILVAYVPLQLALIGWGATVIGTLAPWQALGLALSVGLIAGAQGITFAHELGHKRSRLERLLSRVLLVTVCYGHFTVEHNRGHHVRVATPEDPASARFGESYWAFLPRTLWGSLRHAWELDRAQVLTSVAASVLTMAALGAAFGPLAIAFFIGQSAMAVMLLEGVNYVEHYGLQRRRLPDGRYERMGERHSWDAYEWLSNCFLVHLQRHADHHLEPSRPYAALQPREGSPKLPTGYAGMLPLALVPPLWFRVMNPRVPERPAAPA